MIRNHAQPILTAIAWLTLAGSALLVAQVLTIQIVTPAEFSSPDQPLNPGIIIGIYGAAALAAFHLAVALVLAIRSARHPKQGAIQ